MNRYHLILAIVLAVAAIRHAAASQSTINLSELKWSVTNANKSLAFNTKLPAYALELARQQGIIKDPLYRYENKNNTAITLVCQRLAMLN